MEKVGVIIGKFMPFHAGHKWMIREASKYVDKLIILVCFTEGETYSPMIRKEILTNNIQLTNNCEAIIKIFDEQLGDSKDGVSSDYNIAKVWGERLVELYPEITHFIGGEPYVGYMAQATGKTAIFLNRKFGYSATKVRNGELSNNYYHKIPKICITGIESSGKSTLVSQLKEYLGEENIETVDEYGRIYCEINSPLDSGKDFFLDDSEFKDIAIGHNRLVIRAEEKAVAQNKKAVIVDTDHIITHEFYKRYLDKESEFLKSMCKAQHYDLVLFCNRLDFANDSTRRLVSEEEREDQEQSLLSEIKKYNKNVVLLEKENRLERLEKAVSKIRELMLCY